MTKKRKNSSENIGFWPFERQMPTTTNGTSALSPLHGSLNEAEPFAEFVATRNSDDVAGTVVGTPDEYQLARFLVSERGPIGVTNIVLSPDQTEILRPCAEMFSDPMVTAFMVRHVQDEVHVKCSHVWRDAHVITLHTLKESQDSHLPNLWHPAPAETRQQIMLAWSALGCWTTQMWGEL